MNPSPTLSFHQLGCTRGGRPLFQGINRQLEAGQWLYVVGANGAGKTSLLRMVCGLSPTDAGDILWNGTPIHDQRDAYHQDLCYLGHLNALQESMTVHENLSFTAALGGHTLPKQAADEVLSRFGMPARGHQLVRHLSQGQKRRVALSRLALSPARLWVLDEPLVGLDAQATATARALLQSHLDAGGALVMTSHHDVQLQGPGARFHLGGGMVAA